MSNIKNIIDSIVQGILTNTQRSFVIREDRILDKLLKDKDRKSSQFRYVGQILLLSFGVLAFIYVLLSMISFFLFDVILFEPRVYTTSKGATVITQPCGIEHAFFLHNSASVWTDSGIDIVKGDEIEITYSGSFYSSLRNQAMASYEKKPLKYYWFTFKRTDKTAAKTIEFCMYDSLQDNAAIGNLLFRIGNYEGIHNIHQINNNRNKFKADYSGTLHVAVNDIYIPDTMTVKNMLLASDTVFSKVQKEELVMRLDYDKSDKEKKDILCDTAFLHLLNDKHTDVVNVLAEGADWNANSIWYDDNSGELFVNVKITRNNLNYSNPINRFFALLYRIIEIFWNINKLVLIGLLTLLVLLYVQLIYFYDSWKSSYIRLKKKIEKNTDMNLQKKE